MMSIKRVLRKLLDIVFVDIARTRGTAAPITYKNYFMQKVLGFNKTAYWPTHFTSVIGRADRIQIGIGCAPGLSPGCYIQGSGGIRIGDYTLVGPGVGLISKNHDVYNIATHKDGGIEIGQYCWIGMNAIILPKVKLGDHTIVAAGSVVNKSFSDGYCVVAGVPARVVKRLEKSKVVEKKNDVEYVGFYPVCKFRDRIHKILDVSFIQ